MYTGRGSLGFNAVVCTSGKFSWVPEVQASPDLVLTMTYVDQESGRTFGSCAVSPQILSDGTISALRKFIELAEEDFGMLAFKEGKRGEGAESGEGLKPLGG